MMLNTTCQSCGLVRRHLINRVTSFTRSHSSYQPSSLLHLSQSSAGRTQNFFLRSANIWRSPFKYSNFSMTPAFQHVEHQTRADACDHEEEGDVFEGLSSEDVKRLKVLQLERDVWDSEGHRVPLNVTKDMWVDILHNYKSTSSRKKVYKFWFKKEIYREKARKKKEESLERRMQRMEDETDEPNQLSNSIFQRYSRTRINHQLYIPRLVHAMMHGPHLVVDMGFYEHMTRLEIKNVARQLMSCHGFNQIQDNPFHLHFSNLDGDSPLTTALFEEFTGLDSVMCSTTEQDFLELYPKENIVYLSPNAPAVMEEFDHDAVYIVGGIVDKGAEEPLTFAKAKREKLKCLKFPLDRYLQWVQGKKSLTLDQVVKILWTLKETNSDWIQALQHVPSRKFQWRSSTLNRLKKLQ